MDLGLFPKTSFCVFRMVLLGILSATWKPSASACLLSGFSTTNRCLVNLWGVDGTAAVFRNWSMARTDRTNPSAYVVTCLSFASGREVDICTFKHAAWRLDVRAHEKLPEPHRLAGNASGTAPANRAVWRLEREATRNCRRSSDSCTLCACLPNTC